MTHLTPAAFDQALDTALHISAARLKLICRQLRPAHKRHNSIPVLGTVLLQTGETGTTFRLTNLDLQVTVTADDLATAAPFRACVPFDLLARIANSLDGAIRITHQPGGTQTDTITKLKAPDQLTLATDDGMSATINLLCGPDDFPDSLTRDDGLDWRDLALAPATLRRLVDLARHCISREETRYYLNGIYLCARPDAATLRAVATDGHRMAIIDCDTPAPTGLAIILPTGAVDAIRHLIAPKSNEPVTLRIAGTRARLTQGAVQLDAKLIDGTFPDYTRVIPMAEIRASVAISGASLRRLDAFCTERIQAVLLEGHRATLHSPGREAEASVPIAITTSDGQPYSPLTKGYYADPVRWGFNLTYLLDQARATPVFRMDLAAPFDPALIRSEDPAALWVLMPMRV